MHRTLATLTLAPILALALTLPAAAGVGAFDLPRLGFSGPTPPTQGCAQPATLEGTSCSAPRS